jgi:hypothetical protein
LASQLQNGELPHAGVAPAAGANYAFGNGSVPCAPGSSPQAPLDGAEHGANGSMTHDASAAHVNGHAESEAVAVVDMAGGPDEGSAREALEV